MKAKKLEAELSSQDRTLGLDASITRRDFVGSSLVGAGAALLGAAAPALSIGAGRTPAVAHGLTSEWTGFGGVGDYARSNGNTHEVVNAAHAVRDGELEGAGQQAQDTGEHYDVVIVGGGFSGLGAAHGFLKERGAGGRALLLDNHPMIGGEAKQNEFEVDGYRLYGPQGSNSFVVAADGSFPEIWNELGLPEQFSFRQLTGTARAIRVAPDNFAPMMKWPSRASVGYFFPTPDGKGQWVIGAQENAFADAPLTEELRRGLNAALQSSAPLKSAAPEDWQRWLDSMTYQDFLVKELGLPPRYCIDTLIRILVPPRSGSAAMRYLPTALTGCKCRVR